MATKTREDLDVAFDYGMYTRDDRRDARVWIGARDLVTELVHELFPGSGQWVLVPHRKTQWQGQHRTQIKLGKHQHHRIYLTIRQPGCGNGHVWEYRLHCAEPDWDVAAAYNRLAAHILQQSGAQAEEALDVPDTIENPEPEETTMAQAITQPETPPIDMAKLSISERVRLLEERAGRNQCREERMIALQQQQGILKDRLADLQQQHAIEEAKIQKQIDDLDECHLELLNEVEHDQDCVEAQQALAALQRILGP